MKLSRLGLWICLPVFNTLNQVAMKLTAGVVAHDNLGLQWLLDAAASPYIWLSFACEIASFVAWLAILRQHKVSQAFPLTSLSYAALMLVSWFFFREPMHAQQIAGIAIIMAGIAVMGFGTEEPPAPDASAGRA